MSFRRFLKHNQSYRKRGSPRSPISEGAPLSGATGGKQRRRQIETLVKVKNTRVQFFDKHDREKCAENDPPVL